MPLPLDPYEDDEFPPPPNAPPSGAEGGPLGTNLPGGNPGNTPPIVPGPLGNQGHGGGGAGGGGGAPAYPHFNIPGAPVFNAPDFVAPTLADAYNEPGYQFRLGSGVRALEASAAARGLLRTGGTLTDVNQYGQRFAESEFKNVYDRALQAHGANYRAAHDEFAPQLAHWQVLANAHQQAQLAQFGYQWQQHLQPHHGGGNEVPLELLIGPPPKTPGNGLGHDEYDEEYY